MALLSVQNLVVRFRSRDGTVFAVNGVDLEIERGETLALVGESGCGKTVTGLTIIRLLPKPYGQIESGHVIFEGKDLLKVSERNMRDLRGRDIAMVFQDPMTSLNPVLTVEKQLVETFVGHAKMKRAAARSRAVRLLDMVGIPNPEQSLRRYPHQLSGGMRQRVMIAMALALSPKLLIADEPTTALDVTMQAQVLDLVRGLTQESGTAVMLITHDLGVVATMAQRVSIMYAGFVVETGTTAEVFSSPRHPYTVGLLHSIPRIEGDDGDKQLIPIEGAPPDQHREPTGCPFAPRCAWRLPVCWLVNPPLEWVNPRGAVVETGSTATQRTACHNPVSAKEVLAGRPLRAGFVPASPPDELARRIEEEIVEVLP